MLSIEDPNCDPGQFYKDFEAYMYSDPELRGSFILSDLMHWIKDKHDPHNNNMETWIVLFAMDLSKVWHYTGLTEVTKAGWRFRKRPW